MNLEYFPNRLNQIMDDNNLTASSLAAKLDVQRSNISHILSGRNNPSLEFITKLLEAFSYLTFDWLVYGEDGIKGNSIKKRNNTNLSGKQIDIDFESISKDKSTKKTSPKPIENIPSLDKVLKRIILIYDDGTFESFTQ